MINILVPTDFSDNAQNAFRYALLFSESCGGSVELVHVVPPNYQLVEAPMAMSVVSDLWLTQAKTDIKKFVEETLLQVQSSHQLRELPDVKYSIEVGAPITRVLETAYEKKADLIIMGTQGEHNRLDRFLGSVSSMVVKKANTPVLIIPEDVTYQPIEKITIAIDLKESDPWEIFKATDIIGTTLKEVNLVHVYPEGKTPNSQITIEDLEYYYKKNKPQFNITYSALTSSNLNASLNKQVAKNQSDLLVMLGPHMSGFQKMFWQSNTGKMTYDARVGFLRV